MFVVIAGNKQQYVRWLKEWGYSGDMRRKKSDFTYIFEPNKLRGMNSGHKVVFVGTYWENPVYKSQELHMLMRTTNARPLIFGDENFHARMLELDSTVKLLTHYANLVTPFAARALSGRGGKVVGMLLRLYTELRKRGVGIEHGTSWGFEIPSPGEVAP